MENVILIVHLLLALALIGIVLMQRSEGGGLGIGGGGGLSGRAAANPLARITWGLAIAFICTSLTLTILAAQNAGGLSVVDRLTGGTAAPVEEEDGGGDAGLGSLLPPPTQETDESLPLVPRGN